MNEKMLRSGELARLAGVSVERKASATFSEADRPANIKNQERMIELAGSPERVIPGHDALQFQKYSTQGRVARIR